MSSLKPIAALNAAGYHPVATDGSNLTNIMAVTLVGPAANRSCNILYVDYNTLVPIGQRDGTISYPYLNGAEAIAYIATQPADSAWEIICGPGTEPSTLSIPAGYTIIFVGHDPAVSVLANITQTADLPNLSFLHFRNIAVGDIVCVDGTSPNGLLVQTENAKRGSITQTGTSLVYVVDTGSIDEGFPYVFPRGVVEGDTIVTGRISGTNVVYESGCNELNGQLVNLSGCSIEAANITVVDTAVIKNTQWKFYSPQIINNAGDFPIEVYLDSGSSNSWNDKRGIAPTNTFVTLHYDTNHEEYSCNSDDRYYFGRQSVVQFRSEWNSPTATWDYLPSPPTRGASFTTGVPSQARASVSLRKDWLLVQPSVDALGMFIGSKQQLHPPGSTISVELGPFSMDASSVNPFNGPDTLYWMFSEQTGGGDLDIDNFVLLQVARIAVDTWYMTMIVRQFGSVIYSNNNIVISDTCPVSYAQISKNGSVVEAFYSRDEFSWKSAGVYDTVLAPMALDRVSVFVQAGQIPNTIFGFKEFNTSMGPTI